MTITKFEEIKAWNLAREQAKEIHKLTNKECFARDFELRKQMNSSSGSVMDNIAEGFERSANGEFKYFLGVAKGSNGEVRSQLYRVLDRKYITQSEFDSYYNKNAAIGGKLNTFIDYLVQSPLKGQRFNDCKNDNKPVPHDKPK